MRPNPPYNEVTVNERYRYRLPNLLHATFVSGILAVTTGWWLSGWLDGAPFSARWFAFVLFPSSLFVVLGTYSLLAWLNDGLILSDNEVLKVGFLGTITRRIPYGTIKLIRPPTNTSEDFVMYTLDAGTRKLKIPEQALAFRDLRSKILAQVHGEEPNFNRAAKSDKLVGSYPVPCLSAVSALQIFNNVAWCGLMVLTHYVRQAHRWRAWQTWQFGWLALFAFALATTLWTVGRRFRKERLLLYEDRIERIAPNGEVTSSIPFKDVVFLDAVHRSGYYGLESADDRISIPKKSPVVGLVNELLDRRTRLEWLRQNLPAAN